MPSETASHDTNEGLSISYYSSGSAQASATTVPLIYRISGGTAHSSDLDETSSLPRSIRHSELYNGLWEEVKQPNTPSRMIVAGNEDNLPPSLRVASFIGQQTAELSSAQHDRSQAVISKSQGRGDHLNPASDTDSRRISRSIPRTSLQKQGSGRRGREGSRTASRQQRQPRMVGALDSRDTQMLPNLTFNPDPSQDRLTINSNQYTPYRPQGAEKQLSRKPIAAAGAAVVGTAAGGAVAYSMTNSIATPLYDGSGFADREVTSTGFINSPFDDGMSFVGYDNSTPGSPHDSPLQFAQSPSNSAAPDRNPFASAQDFSSDTYVSNDFDNTRALQASPVMSPLETVSPSSSFGGPEGFPADSDRFRAGFTNPFSPLEGLNPESMDRSLPVPPEMDIMSPNASFEGATRSICLSDAEPDYSDEKGSGDEAQKQAPLWKRYKLLIITLAVSVFLLIAIGAGVGIFFAIRNKNKGAPNTAANNSNSPAGPNDQNVPIVGGFRTQDPALVNDAFVMTQTSMSTVTFGGTSNRKRQTSNRKPTGVTNFFNFYQHSNGEIRMARFQNSNFQPSVLVASDSHQGTPVAAYSRSDIVQISVFYFNKEKILQEVRSQDGVKWTPGSIGRLGLTSDAPSDLSVEYAGACRGSGLAWLVFHTGINNQTKLVYWDQATDTWTEATGFPGVKQGAGFAGQTDGDAWRFYYVSSQNSQLSQMVCPNCCNTAGAPAWTVGINGPPVTSATGGITVVAAASPRLIYYQDADGTVRELNNTGVYPREAYQLNVATGRNGNTGTPAPGNAPIGPVGTPVAQVIPETKMAISAGFIGSVPSLWLFAQWNITTISVSSRKVDVVGQWTTPFAIPVQRS